MKFEQYPFDDRIKTNLLNLKFKRPTDIQFKAIPSVLKGEDVLAIAQTGTGKTAAFAIPVLQRILSEHRNNSVKGVYCVVMVPTRELALQITKVFRELGAHTRVETACLIGGVEDKIQIETIERGARILITTTGRMFDLHHRGILTFQDTKILVLDEADQMLALGFYKDIKDVVRLLPRKHQTLFFSATINEEIKELAYSLVFNPIRIQISPKDPVSKNVDHYIAFIALDDKRFFLERLIRENEEKKILIFVRTKVRAERVHQAMNRVGLKTLTIHGDKTQDERNSAMQQFREGTTNILIATDLSARGIDIEGVNLVVNYDLPDVPENYVHRVGRTGRGTQKGLAYAFCAEEEKPLLQEIEKYTTKEIKVLDIDKSDYRLTIALTSEGENNWAKLIQESEKLQSQRKRKPFKKK
ncbi:MAG TPA: ATP-dependent helicase [Chitinophagaceae bacterium]|nr:ATP-dependent helicase [Chitinophagaceae bacterium]